MSKAQGSVVISLLVLMFCFQLYEVFKPAKPAARTKYDYQVESIKDDEWGTKSKKLGQDGWEIITCRRASNGDAAFTGAEMLYECIMRRPMEEPAAITITPMDQKDSAATSSTSTFKP